MAATSMKPAPIPELNHNLQLAGVDTVQVHCCFPVAAPPLFLQCSSQCAVPTSFAARQHTAPTLRSSTTVDPQPNTLFSAGWTGTSSFVVWLHSEALSIPFRLPAERSSPASSALVGRSHPQLSAATMASPRRRPTASTLRLLLALALLLLSCAAAAVSDDADDVHARHDEEHEAHLGLSKAEVAEVADEDETDLELSRRDFAALGLKSDQLKKELDDDSHGDELAASLKNLGLSDKELSEIKKLEDETKTGDGGDMAAYHGKRDRRAADAAPPLGMVARPVHGNRGGIESDQAPPPPHEPRNDVVEKERKAAEARAEARAEASRKEVEALQAKISMLTQSLGAERDETQAVRLELSRSRESYDRTLDSERQEHKSSREELTTAIEERKRAFDELYEEKQVLGQILSEEQKTLHELQEKIQHPDLGLWIRQRAERAAILVETPETDAMKFYARKYMAPKVTKMRHRLALLEKRVEKSVDHLLPAQYGSVVAFMLSIGLIGFPVFVTMSTVVSVTKSVSLRQYVLLGNVFLTAFSSGLCIAGLILQQDPLQTLYEASESLFVILQLAAAIVFPMFVGVIFCAVLKSRDQEDLFVFGCELVFYILVGLNYRARVWRPAMLGQNIETSRMMYVVYVIDFLSMTALTISSAKMEHNRLPSFVRDSQSADAEAGQSANKVVGTTGTAALGSTRSGLGALSSGLMKAAMSGDNSAGKEE